MHYAFCYFCWELDELQLTSRYLSFSINLGLGLQSIAGPIKCK